MIKNIDVTFGKILTEAEINNKAEEFYMKIKYNAVFSIIVSVGVFTLLATYFIENTHFNILFYMLGSFALFFVTVFATVGTVLLFTDSIEKEIKSKYTFIDFSENETLFYRIYNYPILARKMKEILEIRPKLTKYEYDTFKNLAELIRDQEKNAELLQKINAKC